MQKIDYIDLHCDSITNPSGRQVTVDKLLSSGCMAQCFAIFTNGKSSAAKFDAFAAFYNANIALHPHICPVYCVSDIIRARQEGKAAAILTVENLGFLEEGRHSVKGLKELGVQMASLVWNDKNAFALPNLIYINGAPDFSKRERGGLTAAGKRLVEELNESRIIVDISHLADGGVDDVLSLSSAPVVASHSNAFGVHPISRNLTDGQIKRLADKGGVIGLNFCRDFIGVGDELEGLYRHLKHIISVGGDGCVALGSDFDGIPPYESLKDCTATQKLLNYFLDSGISYRTVEKLAYKNFLRVFEDVVG